MGKFERGEAEQLEKSLVDLLNGKRNTNSFHRCTENLAKTIILTNRNVKIKRAIFIGRNYSEPGNVKLITEDEKVLYVELKLVTSGKGTRANISQDALTDLGLLYDSKGRTISWSEFRKINKFNEKILSELNKFRKYPENVITKEEKAKYLIENFIRPSPGKAVEIEATEILKKSNNPDEIMAAKIILNIVKLAREDKLSYIQYLKNIDQDSEKIKKFTILLLLGFHSMSSLTRGFSKFKEIVDSLSRGEFNIKTYYVIRRNCGVFVEDLSCIIPKLLNTQFRIEFPKDETNVIVSYYDEQKRTYEHILRIVFHWKNILQGIKTPCLNIFDEGPLRKYLACLQT